MPNTLTVPEQITTTIDRVAPGVTGLRTIMVNLYGVQSANGSWTLIDAGLYFQEDRIRRWADEHFGRNARPACILLTHGHFDHVGSLKKLAEQWDVPVYAHPLEMPYLTGRSKYPPPDPVVGGGSLALLSPLYPRGPINLARRVRPLAPGGAVPELPGWQWIHTPGHTAGHVSFFRKEDQVLIAGDAFVTTKQESFTAVVQQRPELHGPPAYYTSDWEAARQSVRRLAELGPNVFACGHGLPMAGPRALDALYRLAEDFDDIARPKVGRYVWTPAITDERGTISVPPPVIGPVPKFLIGTAVCGVVWYALSPRKARLRNSTRPAARV
jgi:glyoxylase-like metal-dependent hydrolase (beta-lactamase superfamily II)